MSRSSGGEPLPRTILQQCERCGSYGLQRTCDCGGTRWAAGPMRFSPEDPQGERRRATRDSLDAWMATLPAYGLSAEEEE